MLGTGTVWVFPQPLLPQMLAGFLDPTLGLIVTLPGPMRTAVYVGTCSAEVTSVLPMLYGSGKSNRGSVST